MCQGLKHIAKGAGMLNSACLTLNFAFKHFCSFINSQEMLVFKY